MARGSEAATSEPEFGGASAASSALASIRTLQVLPIPMRVARKIVIYFHYLHSFPAGTRIALGVFLGLRSVGALTFGVGSANAHALVIGASPRDCLTLTRFCLSDDLPRNSESRVLGLVLRALRRSTDVKFVLSYADPSRHHRGVIYQATNWLYTGLSDPTPLYDLGDGVGRHPRSVAAVFGSRSVRHFARNGVAVTTIPQTRKFRYVFFLDRTWRSQLRVPALPYPKEVDTHGGR